MGHRQGWSCIQLAQCVEPEFFNDVDVLDDIVRVIRGGQDRFPGEKQIFQVLLFISIHSLSQQMLLEGQRGGQSFTFLFLEEGCPPFPCLWCEPIVRSLPKLCIHDHWKQGNTRSTCNLVLLFDGDESHPGIRGVRSNAFKQGPVGVLETQLHQSLLTVDSITVESVPSQIRDGFSLNDHLGPLCEDLSTHSHVEGSLGCRIGNVIQPVAVLNDRGQAASWELDQRFLDWIPYLLKSSQNRFGL